MKYIVHGSINENDSKDESYFGAKFRNECWRFDPLLRAWFCIPGTRLELNKINLILIFPTIHKCNIISKLPHLGSTDNVSEAVLGSRYPSRQYVFTVYSHPPL